MPSNAPERPDPPSVAADDVISTVQRWVAESVERPRSRGRRGTTAPSHAAMLRDPRGIDFAVDFVDHVVRPEDLRVAARNLERLSRRLPETLPWRLRVAMQLGGGFAPLVPWPIVPIARAVFRRAVAHLVLDATPKRLERALARVRASGIRLDLSLLGEFVLGDAEAQRRLDATQELLARPDVDSVSIAVSSVFGRPNLWSFDETVDRVVARLTPLYEFAAGSPTSKFINLDLEEFRDLDLTVAVFQGLLSQPKLHSLEAGIVVQTYLPESFAAMQDLTTWALARRRAGGAGIKVRVVKGANLAMERVDAIVHGWPLAPWSSKHETDTNHKRVLDWSLTQQHTDAVRIGVAGHNLFDVAYAWLLAKQRGVERRVDFEMLLGTAAQQAEAVRSDVGGLLLYAPVAHPGEFDSAIFSLIRRLGENASAENYLSEAFDLADDRAAFARQANRFASSLAAMERSRGDRTAAGADASPTTHRTQDRRGPEPAGPEPGTFSAAPHTDATVAANREWARGILERVPSSRLGSELIDSAHIADEHTLDRVIAGTASAGSQWGERRGGTRGQVVRAAGESIAEHRAELIEVVVSETGATFAEADAEVSGAVDFANYYAELAADLDRVDDARFIPNRLTAVMPAWNSPVAAAAGSTLAALAGGSAVILKPAQQARRCAAVLVDALWAAGMPREILSLVDLDERLFARQLVTHDDVDHVVFTGEWETAALFRSWRPDLSISAETGGSSAIVVTPSADFDLAAADVAQSAFAQAGQEPSAATLAILVGSVGRSERFRSQLVDAVQTLRPGYPRDPATTLGPVIGPARGILREALTALDGDERWLLKPRALDEGERVWSPGIRDGVAPGSRFHLTPFRGPVLGIMRVRTLDDAIAAQNATDFGLAAGIHSLDASEVSRWVDSVEAGDLFVNRRTTGALVRRQPFGGWKRSSVGAGQKAGGPNAVLSLGNWAPIPAEPSASVQLTGLSERVASVIEAAQQSMEFLEFDQVRRAALSDERAWQNEFGLARDASGLVVERNVLRYLPVPVTIRLAEGASLSGLVRMLAAATRVQAPVSISSALPLGPALIRLLSGGRAPLDASGVLVESDARWHARMQEPGARPARIRLVGGSRAALAAVVQGDPDVTLFAGPVTASGRIELLTFLREQSVSITAHRYGQPDPAMIALSL